jgi:dCTP deaminase
MLLVIYFFSINALFYRVTSQGIKMLKSDKWIRRQCSDEFRFSVVKSEKIEGCYKPISQLNNLTQDEIESNLLFSLEINGFRLFIKNYKDQANFIIIRTDNNVDYYFIIVIDYKNSRFNNKSMIIPFVGESIKHDDNGNKIPSYGLSSYGYDIRLGRNVKLFKKQRADFDISKKVIIKKGTEQICKSLGFGNFLIDPSNFSTDVYDEYNDIDEIIIPPHGFILGHTVEYFNMPRRIMGICMGKSTLARCGIGVLVTPLEPGWSGYLTLEIVNHTQLPVRIQTGIGICQINFLESDEDCETSYADRGGKYQNQPMIPVDPKV